MGKEAWQPIEIIASNKKRNANEITRRTKSDVKSCFLLLMDNVDAVHVKDELQLTISFHSVCRCVL